MRENSRAFLCPRFEQLLIGLLQCEAKIADRGHEGAVQRCGPEKDREGERAFGAVVVLPARVRLDGLMRQVAVSNDMRNLMAVKTTGVPALGEVDLEEGAVLDGEAAEGIEGLDIAGAAGPSGAGAVSAATATAPEARARIARCHPDNSATGTARVTVSQAVGSCTTSNPNPNPNPESFAAVGDFNGDGKGDILWRNSSI